MTDRPTDRTAIALGYCVLQERQAVKQTRNVRVANRCNDLGQAMRHRVKSRKATAIQRISRAITTRVNHSSVEQADLAIGVTSFDLWVLTISVMTREVQAMGQPHWLVTGQ